MSEIERVVISKESADGIRSHLEPLIVKHVLRSHPINVDGLMLDSYVSGYRDAEFAIRAMLVTMSIGSCNCGTKTPVVKFHADTCIYGIYAKFLDVITTPPEQPE